MFLHHGSIFCKLHRFQALIQMKFMDKNSIAEEKYCAPKCVVFSVVMESIIAESGSKSGEAGEENDIIKYEDY